jgi:thrombospondin motif-containing protein 12
MQGIILTENDEYYLLKPPSLNNYYSKNNTSKIHTIQKRSTNIQKHHSCSFDSSQDPYPEDQVHSADPSFLAVHKFNELIIELGVFVDDAMWQFFEKFYGSSAEKEIKRFVIATVNNIDILFTRSTIEPKVRLKITHFEILKTMPMPLTRTYHNSGDVNKMLNSFCTYQSSINPKNDADPKHWDHALLLTGYDLYRDNVKTIAGYAPVKGMCEQVHNKSCTVNEGLDFGAVFVITHEMGHSLGMLHDGESNQCQSRCCIMSPSIGEGKTQWSGCSVNELHTFVSRFGTGDRPSNCLIDDRTLTLQNEKLYLPDKILPGQQYSIDEQCSLFHGTCWKQELQTGQALKDICTMLWCTNGESVVRNTHPALEGSYCSTGRICVEGKCVTAASQSVTMSPINGGWGPWDDASKCSQGCNDCKIEGQLRVKRSVRMCNNPL